MQYNVHVYAPVRMLFKGIEAESQQDAMNVAEERFLESVSERLSMDKPFGGVVEHAEWDESFSAFLVDEVGDDEYTKSCAYDGLGRPQDQVDAEAASLRLFARYRALVEQIAGLRNDQEASDGKGGWVEDPEAFMDADDAIDTLRALITKARELTATEPPPAGRIQIIMDGGLIEDVQADIPGQEAIVVDNDVDGPDHPSVIEVDGGYRAITRLGVTRIDETSWAENTAERESESA